METFILNRIRYRINIYLPPHLCSTINLKYFTPWYKISIREVNDWLICCCWTTKLDESGIYHFLLYCSCCSCVFLLWILLLQLLWFYSIQIIDGTQHIHMHQSCTWQFIVWVARENGISILSMIASAIVLALFIYFLGGIYCSCLPFIQFHSLFCWILRFPCSERPSFRWAWPVRSFHPCLHRRLLAALSVAHGGLGKTLLSHILVKIMVKIVAKVVDNFIVFWAGVFCD